MADNTVGNKIFSIIQSVNQACVQGTGFDELADSFAEDITIYPPGFSRCAKGKETNLRMYKDFCSKANIRKMDASDPHVDIFGDTAIVNYRYNSQWEFNGSRFDEDGREIIVLKNNHNRWQIIWRTLIIGNRKIDGAVSSISTEAGHCDDIRSQCTALMANSPACQLTTIDADGYPHTTAMNNLRDKNLYPDLAGLFQDQDNDFILYLSTHNQSNKMARMLANPKVSVYFCDAPHFYGLMLGGRIEIITDPKLKNKIWQKGWRMYYPNGPEGPEYGVLRLTPTIIKGWNCTGEFKLDASRK